MWQRQFLRKRSVQALRLRRAARESSLYPFCRSSVVDCYSAPITTSTSRKYFHSSRMALVSLQEGPPEGGPFRVLVANRGEIVQRIQKTCRQYPDLFETVVVYSTADAKAPFVTDATGPKVCIGPPAASESYLNVEKILQTIDETGSHMVHPGYGFLSENADFANAVTNQAGAIWLGSPPHAVQEMGDKIRSKEVALEAGVNVIPGYEGVLESVEQARAVANDVLGYPILLKAAAGGGGKGTHLFFFFSGTLFWGTKQYRDFHCFIFSLIDYH